MLRRKYFQPILILFCFFLAGCFWVLKPKPTITDIKESSAGTKTTKVLNLNQLKAGGSLLIVPFKAGVGVEATDELDQTALMIVKGIADELKKSPFTILTAENADTAQLLLKGHVVKKSLPSRLSKWGLGKRELCLGVQGEILDQKTGSRLMVFSREQRENSAKANFKSLGYNLGQDVGRYIKSIIE